MDSYAADGMYTDDEGRSEEERGPKTFPESAANQDGEQAQDEQAQDEQAQDAKNPEDEDAPQIPWFSDDLATISDKMTELNWDENIVRYCHDALVEIQKAGVDVSTALQPLQDQADLIHHRKTEFSKRLKAIFSDLHFLMQDVCEEASQVKSLSELAMPPPLCM